MVGQPKPAAVWSDARSVAEPRFSPDGSSVLFAAGDERGTHLVVVPSAGGAEQRLACCPPLAGTAVFGSGIACWLPDGSGIVYLGRDGLVHRLDLATSRCFPLTRTPEDVTALSMSPCGDEVACVVDNRDVVVATTVEGGPWPRRVSAGADFAMDPAWSSDGMWLAWHEWDAPDMPWYGGRIAVRRSDGSGPVRVVDGGDGVAVAQPQFSPDGRLLSYLSDRTGWLNLWAADVDSLDSGARPDRRPLVEAAAEFAVPAWGPGQRTYCWDSVGSTVFYYRNDRGWGSLEAWNADEGRRTQVRGTVGELTADRGRVAAVVADPAHAPSIQVVDPDGGSVVLARSAMANVESNNVEPEPVSWTSDDGTTIPGRLYRTPLAGAAPPPLLVWLHEGPTGQALVTFHERFGYFLERGWSVLVPDYRGSSGWGRAFLEALDGQWGDADVADAASAVRAAVDNGWGDPGRIVAYGGSAGGFLTVQLLARHPGLCAAGVALFPVSNLVDFTTPPWRYQRHYFDRLLGELPEHYRRYEERSPVNLARDVAAPLLVLHGDRDPIVREAHSAELVEKIRAGGGTVEHHVYEDEGHGWLRSGSLADELERVESFLRRHVLRVRADCDAQPGRAG